MVVDSPGSRQDCWLDGVRMKCIAVLALSLCALGGPAAQADDDDNAETEAGVFAVVGTTVIPLDEFESNFHAGVRQRFFHGSVPETEIAAFRREVAQDMVDRVLLLQEAERRGITPDEEWVGAQLQQAERRIAFASDPDQVRDTLRQQLQGDSSIMQLRGKVEDIPAPGRAAMLAYYQTHPDQFTTPERVRVSLILLKVEPWSSATVWQAAFEEAQRIVAKLKKGASFGDLARLHSADESAARGGDLGYIHKGMLAAEAQEVVDQMKPGELSEPIHLLQGFAILRLDERTAPVLNGFEQVEGRARELLGRELKEEAWQKMVAELRDRTTVRINEAVLSGEE